MWCRPCKTRRRAVSAVRGACALRACVLVLYHPPKLVSDLSPRGFVHDAYFLRAAFVCGASAGRGGGARAAARYFNVLVSVRKEGGTRRLACEVVGDQVVIRLTVPVHRASPEGARRYAKHGRWRAGRRRRWRAWRGCGGREGELTVAAWRTIEATQHNNASGTSGALTVL